MATGFAKADDNDSTPELHRMGTKLYANNCSICHGPSGEGDGSLAKEFTPKPRNFVGNSFRFASTFPGEAPARADILRIIENGIETSTGRSMPSFTHFTVSERLALAEVIRQFAGIAAYGTQIDVPRPTATVSDETGRQLFKTQGCVDCHGDRGDGNGILADNLRDENGEIMRPANLTVGKFKAGNSPERIWTTIHSGLPGTPMPGFGQVLSDEEIWSLTAFVLALKN